MIYAKNTDALSYRGIHPNLDLALEHITPDFLSRVGSERVELKGGDVYATRFTYETIPAEESFFEAHRKYLDIHIMVSGSEGVEIAPPEALTEFDRRPATFTPTGARGTTSLSSPPGTSWWSSPETPTALRCAWTARRPSARWFSR